MRTSHVLVFTALYCAAIVWFGIRLKNDEELQVKLIHILQLKSSAEYFEFLPGLYPVPTTHPPSLKNPIRVKTDMPTDGFHIGDSKADREKAKADLVEILHRTRRQGKPELSHTALYPAVDMWRSF